MSRDLNDCKFIGRLGRDPEVRYTQSGEQVAQISLACGWKTRTAEGTEWVRIVAFGKLAEIMGEHLRKGAQVYIGGRMRTRQWDKDGEKRYSTEIVAEDMQMLGSRASGSSSSGQSQEAPQAGDAPDFDDESIPF